MIIGAKAGVLVVGYDPAVDLKDEDREVPDDVKKHFWLGSDDDSLLHGVLCWRAKDDKLIMVDAMHFAVTKDKSKVKCQDCLELIHS